VKRKNRLLVLFLLVAHLGWAQTNDARLWLKATAEKKINRKFSVHVEACSRIGENMSRLETYYVAAGGAYKPKKWISLGFQYRHSGKREINPYFNQRDRVSFDLGFKKKFLKRIVFEPRLRYQRQYTALNTSEKGYIPSNYIRGKAQISLDLDKRYEPYVSSELYYQIKYDKSEPNRVRYAAGVAYALNKHHKIYMYLVHQREFNEPEPVRSYIIGFSYKFTF
jgi:hypothetical protein